MRLKLVSVIMIITQAGCATILQSGPDEIHVSSNPPGADVYLNHHQLQGVTPLVVKIRHSEDADIQVSKYGYHDASLTLHKVMAGWTMLNLLLSHAFFIGIGIDLLTHNQGKYPEDNINVDLRADSVAPVSIDPVHSQP